MNYLDYWKKPEEIVNSNINSRAIQAIRQVMERGIREANESYNKGDSYIEGQRKKSFNYELHKVLTKIFKEDPIGKHIGVSVRVINSPGMFNRLEFVCGNIIISVLKAEKKCLPIDSDYKLLLSKNNLCFNNQLTIGLDHSKKELAPDIYYSILTYDLIHDNHNKCSNFTHLDLIVPDYEFSTIMYRKELLRSKDHLRKVEDNNQRRKKGFVTKKILVGIKESSDIVE